MLRFPSTSALLVGLILGLFASTLLPSGTGQIWLLLPSLVTSTATFAVGFWIHTTISNRRALDAIPIRFLDEATGRITQWTNASLDTSRTFNERVKSIRNLSNEIDYLRRIARSWSPSDQVIHALQHDLFRCFFDLKKALTDDGDRPLRAALDANRTLQDTTLKLQMSVSARILDGRISRNTLME